MLRRLILLIWVSVELVAGSAHAEDASSTVGDFTEVDRLHEAGDYVAAAAELHKRAMNGEASAQFAYAVARLLGAGVPADDELDWFIRAADGGYRPAAVYVFDELSKNYPDLSEEKLELYERAKLGAEAKPSAREAIPQAFGSIRSNGRVEVSRRAALQWNKRAAKEGLLFAKFNLAAAHTSNYEDELPILRDAAKAGSPHAALRLVWLEGVLGRKDLDVIARQIRDLSRKVADLGHGPSAILVAKDLEKRWDEESVKRRVYLLRMALAAGEVEAVEMLSSVLLISTRFGETEQREGMALIEQAVRLRIEDADFRHALYLLKGPKSVRDAAEGMKRMEALAESGSVPAAVTFAMELRKANDDPAAHARAVGLIRKAAEGGNATGSLRYGELLLRGEGVERDEAEAFRSIERAARKGLAAAQAQLGWMLMAGIGIERDTEEAATWLELAANKNNYEGQGWLAQLLEHGDGIEKDLKRAKKLRAEAEARYSEMILEDLNKAEALKGRLKEFGRDPQRQLERFVILTHLLAGEPSLQEEFRPEIELLVEQGYRSARQLLIIALMPPPDSETALRILELMRGMETEILDYHSLRFHALVCVEDGSVGLEEILEALNAWRATGDARAEQLAALAKVIPTGRMTDEEYAAAIEKLGERDPNADPTRVHAQHPWYPMSLRQRNVEGEATIFATIDADGNVESAVIDSATNPAFGRAALDAVLTSRFAPKLKDGKPVKSKVGIPYRFRS